LEKIIAHIKGDFFGRVLTENEYYYLMFNCENEDDIKLIKSMTEDECRYYLDCCWYFGIENTTVTELTFMRNYRKFYKPYSNAQQQNDTLTEVLCKVDNRIGDLHYKAEQDGSNLIATGLQQARNVIGNEIAFLQNGDK